MILYALFLIAVWFAILGLVPWNWSGKTTEGAILTASVLTFIVGIFTWRMF